MMSFWRIFLFYINAICIKQNCQLQCLKKRKKQKRTGAMHSGRNLEKLPSKCKLLQ